MSLSNSIFRGKIVFVTGSSRPNGIGAACIRSLAMHGADVAIHHASESTRQGAYDLADSVSKEFGVKTTVISGPIQDRATAERMIKEVMSGLDADHVDILVNNAGASSGPSLQTVTEEDLLHEFHVNTFAPLYLTQSVVNTGKMPPGGRIINISSIASKEATLEAAMYAAAKAATDCLTFSWARELGRSHGITVNAIAPGPVDTDIARPFLWNQDGTPSALQAGMRNKTLAADRIGTPADVGDAVLLIASEQSRWITAQYIAVSGGVIGTM